MDSFLFFFFPCSYFFPSAYAFLPRPPSFGQLYSSGGGLLPAFLTFSPYFLFLLLTDKRIALSAPTRETFAFG